MTDRWSSDQFNQSAILRRVAEGAPLAEVLDALARLIEELLPGVLCSVLLLSEDGRHLVHSAAPSLPADYSRAIDGFEIGPWAGSCGTAAFLGSTVIAIDLATDPHWQDYRELAMPYGLRACWSSPVFGRNGAVLGTFAVYYREPHEPTASELALVREAADLARIVMEQSLSDRTLRQSEERYRRLVAATAQAVWVLGADGTLVAPISTWPAFTGTTEEEIHAGGWLRSVHPDDRKRTETAWIRALSTRTAFEIEHRIRRADGEWRTMIGHAVPLLDEHGQIKEWIGAHTDVTAQRRVEAARRESEAKLALALETAEMGTWTWDVAADLITGPDHFGLLFHRPRSGDPVSFDEFVSAIHPADRDRVVATMRTALIAGSPFQAEFQIGGPDDPECWVGIRAAVVRNGEDKGPHIAGIAMDITARRQAESKLRLLTSAVAHMTDPVIITEAGPLDPPGPRVIYVNAAFCRMTGYEQGELIGQHSPLFRNPRHDREVLRRIGAVVEARETMTIELTNTRKDGSEFPVELTITPVAGERGTVPHLVVVERDLTERRRRDEVLESKMQQAQKLESLGVMAGGIAHDFNNLLVGILGNAGLALMDLPADSPVRDSLTAIEVAARRAAELVGQMLAYSGRGTFQLTALDLRRLVQEMGELLGSVIPKNVEIRYDFSTPIAAVRGDPTQVGQIVMNLMTNAAEALGETGGAIEVSVGMLNEPSAPGDELGLGSDVPAGRYAYLQVADSGCGMDVITRAKMFEPFFTTKFAGRGLGLAAVQGIVRSHRGAIRIRSVPGKGTTVRVFLPAGGTAEVPSSDAAPTIRMPVALRARGTVLVADDEETVRSTSKRLVERAGFKVLLARNGREAIELYDAHAGEIVAVLLDLTMPVLAGDAALDELLRRKPCPPVILTSGFSMEETATRFAGKPLAGFLQKPYRAADLLTMLARIVEQG